MIACACFAVHAQTRRPAKNAPQTSSHESDRAQTPGAHAAAPAGLSDEEQALVAGSKQAILQAGISEPYFNRHFALVSVSAKPSDRRVVWRYAVNEYETLVHDVIGFYSDAGRRVDTHTVARSLAPASEIERTIPRPKAARIMRACIGRYSGAAVVYQTLAAGEQATLYLTAQSVRRESVRRERAERAREARKEKQRGGDTPVFREEDDDDDARPFFIGYVNLVTGKCTRTRGIAR